jgi:hypothetical protein
LDEWRRAVTALVDAENCPHWILGAAAGFAGVLSSLVDLGTTGISLTGYTTTGKTTAQRIAVSAWSSPEIGRGLLESMKATENAVEALAQRSDGTILCLDELGIANGQVLGRLIYAMSSGIGKARMNAHAELRERYSWSTFVVFSGEMSLEERVRSDGGTWMAGMALRIPDIDVTGVNRAVRGAVLERINRLADNYGHAGPRFVLELIRRGLHQQQQGLRDRIIGRARLIAGSSAPGTTVRSALPFALLFEAGELAMQFGILPGDMRLHDAVSWAWRGFTGGAPSVDEQAINALRAWIAERWDVTIHEIASSRVALREAVAWYDQNAVYIPSKRIVEACGGNLSKKHIGQMLREHKLLYAQGGDTVIVRNIPGLAKIDAYALSRASMGRGAAASYEARSFFGRDGDPGQEHHGHH